jgi:Ctr copper transporter family
MVMFAVVVNYIIRHILIALDRGMISALKAAKSETPTDSKIPSDPYETVDVHGMDGVFVQRPKGWQTLKLIHSTIAAFNYGLSLMLMLVAMTFIPSLFLALFIGGVIGEYVCVDFHIDLLMGVYEPKEVYDGALGGLIHWVLCSKHRRNASSEEPLMRDKIKFEFGTWGKLSSWLAPRIISLILLIVTIVWVYQAEGTFGFQSSSVFGWHALCMILFVGVFSNEALLTYTVPLFPQLVYNRKYLK